MTARTVQSINWTEVDFFIKSLFAREMSVVVNTDYDILGVWNMAQEI